MINLKSATVLSLMILSVTANAQKITKLKPVRSVAVSIPEPSDINYNPKTDTFFIASDNGILFETDRDGKIMRKMVANDADFEAVYSDEQNVYAVDETHRNIYVYDLTFHKTRVVNVPFSGAKNKGYEAMTFNKSKNSFVLVTERDPIMLFELDANFKPTNQVDLSKIASDISAASYHDDFLWLLSDESMMLMKLNPVTYEVLAKWSLPVINPEGFTFDKDGNLLVTCDDMQRIYYFNNPEKN